MQYKSEFKSLRGDTINIIITTPAEGEDVELVLSGKEPVVIDYQADDVFKPLKMSGCSVCVLTKEPLLDLYTGTLNQVTLHVYRNNTLIWFGFLTPNVYTSAYKDVYDELTLEFVDPLSAMENVKYTRSQNGQWRSFKTYISEALQKVGAASVLTSIVYDEADVVENVGCMERNFIDETDDDDNAMTYQEVLEEICRYLQVQAICYGDKLMLIDPLKEQTAKSLEDIGLADGQASISLGSVYNSVTVIESTNPIDDVLDTELLEDNNMDSVMSTASSYYDTDIQAYNVQVEKDGETYTDLRAMYRPKTASGWWMKGTGKIAAVADSETKAMATTSVKNASGSLIDKTAFAFYGMQYENRSVPSKLSFTKSIMMVCDTQSLTVGDPDASEARGISGVTDDVFIKYNKSNHTLVMKGGYLVLAMKYKYLIHPISRAEELGELNSKYEVDNFRKQYNGLVNRTAGADKLNTDGKDTFRTMLRIGSKYWNGSAWTTTESWFDLVHTWKGSETLFGTEASLDNTNSYRLRLGDDLEGLAIPIGDKELFGDVEFRICPPSYMAKSYVTVTYWDPQGNGELQKDVYFSYPVGCCEITDLQLAYAQQTSAEAGLVLDTDTKDSDIKITGTMNVQNIFSMDDIEMKVNTWSDMQNSYSYAIRKDGDAMSYYIPTPKPEVSIINRTIDYYSKPMMQYSATLKERAEANITPYDRISIAAFNKTFLVGKIEYDLQNNSAEVTLNQIE